MVLDINQKQKVIEGKVIATRCPCNNPGDLRVFKCVSNDKL